ncbi:MAG: hypothetical protein U9R44_00925 [Candidatus Omnitrophota bacterium]|nr:hypothetical protein [Candidatus Omnitrophota bacterium]
MRRIMIAAAIVAGLAAVYIGAYYGASYLLSDKFMPVVSSFIDDFYLRRDARDYSYIYNEMFGDDFREKIPYEEFERDMKILNRRLGSVRDKKRAGVQIKRAREGRFLIVTYKVYYGKTQTMEGFVLEERSGAWQIFNYIFFWSNKDLSEEAQPVAEDYEEIREKLYKMMDEQPEDDPG